MKRFIITQSDKEFYTSHSGLALIPFLNRVPEKARRLTSKKIPACSDSAHDAPETRIKWNPRKEDQRKWDGKIFDEGSITSSRPGKRVGLLTVRIQQVHEGDASSGANHSQER